ncbi:MAG: diaminopimelate epimerase [Clostridia bacterium]|nr:diaminopimelate epimerase [Clostridia bacterium]
MSRQYRFTKMHGCGNDFILFDCFGQSLFDPETMALILSDRHVGIGADGMVMLLPSDKADFRLRFFDTDGTETPLCGNGLRCAVKLAVDHALTDKTELTVETAAGVFDAACLPETRSRNGKTADVRVDLGMPGLSPDDVGISLPGCPDPVMGAEAAFGGETRIINAVRVGSRFCVLFGEENCLTDPQGETFDIDRFDLDALAAACTRDPLFADGADLCVVKVLNQTTLAVRTCEARNGETRACGTGACAAVVAACLRGRCARGTDVTVRLRGGEMTVRYGTEAEGGRIRLTGPAATVFDGNLLF